MSNERKIWEAACILVRRHGLGAIDEVERGLISSADDDMTYVVWAWIGRCVAELLRLPGTGDTIH